MKDPPAARRAPTAVVIALYLAVLVSGLLVPGLGLLIAVGLAVTILRGRPLVQITITALGLLLLLGAMGLRSNGEPSLRIGPRIEVGDTGDGP